MNSPNSEIIRKEIRLIGTVQSIRRIAKISIVNPQKFLPLPKVTLEAHALGDSKRGDDAALDLLATLPGTFTDGAVFSAGSVEVSRKLVVLAG